MTEAGFSGDFREERLALGGERLIDAQDSQRDEARGLPRRKALKPVDHAARQAARALAQSAETRRKDFFSHDVFLSFVR